MPLNHQTTPPAATHQWTICALLFAATTINYFDRQLFSLLKPILDHELHWTNAQFGWINSLFQGAYANVSKVMDFRKAIFAASSRGSRPPWAQSGAPRARYGKFWP